jgi:patatin-like phospholipase/acyl hydrolase
VCEYIIISTDGGGAKGYENAEFMALAPPEFSTADMYAGTSVGSILMALLATGKTPVEVRDLFALMGPRIFKKSIFRRQIFRAKYSNKVLIEEIRRAFGSLTFGDLPVGVSLVVPAFNITEGKRCIFRTGEPRYKDVLISDAVIASCSAPSYFDAYSFGGSYYIDGGMVINNPARVAVDLALRCGYLVGDLKVLSYSTGHKKIDFLNMFKKWQLMDVVELIDLLLSEQQNTAHEQLVDAAGLKYRRIDMVIQNASGEIDDFSAVNTRAMALDARLTYESIKNAPN